MEKYPKIDMLYGRAKIIGGKESKTNLLDSSIDLKQILKDSQKNLSLNSMMYILFLKKKKNPKQDLLQVVL